MTEEEIYERARYVASEEDSLRHGSLGFAKQDSDYELIVESYFEGAMWAHEQAVKEERRNAVNQLQIVLTAIIARDDSKINFGEIIDQFTELINQ